MEQQNSTRKKYWGFLQHVASSGATSKRSYRDKE
jgi:hypothetical protein